MVLLYTIMYRIYVYYIYTHAYIYVYYAYNTSIYICICLSKYMSLFLSVHTSASQWRLYQETSLDLHMQWTKLVPVVEA